MNPLSIHNSFDFNSRPSARGDISTAKLAMQYGIFQFTPLREGRLHPSEWRYCRQNYFNSRPSARGDAQQRRNHRQPSIFQFTPLREGRQPCLLAQHQKANFNSRPSARGDRRYAKFPRCIFGNPAQRKNSKKVGKEV